MFASFDDTSFVEHADEVGMLDGRETMGHDEGGTFGHEVLEGFLNQFLGLGVECRGGLIQYQNRWVLEDSTCDGEALTLTTGEPTAAITDDGVVPFGHASDELVCVGDPCGVFDRFGPCATVGGG